MHLMGALLERQDSGSGENNPGSNNDGPQTSSTTVVTLSGTSTPVVTPTATATSSTSSSSSSNSSHITIILIVVLVIVALLGLLLVIFWLRRTRRKHKNPKYVPTPFLKRLWEKWEPKSINYRLPTQNDHLEPISSRATNQSRAAGSSPSSFPMTGAESGDIADNRRSTATTGVDRNTSVRSVMTLPPYHQNPLQSEQVLGREGDRNGIDVVIEFPETVDEEEERREEEMEALYQVRLARRRENEEREERRRLRREARERGDYVALREIAARQRADSGANGGRTVEELRAEHDRIKKERLRAVSSVQYADLGVARHDGTRLRANSNDSERAGLLGDAASIGASSRHHTRDRSASSILSIDTTGSEIPSPGLTRERANSRPETPGRDRAGSSPELIEREDLPPSSPPGYENISLSTPTDERPISMGPPPDYSSPVVGRGESPMFESSIPPGMLPPDSISSHHTSPERETRSPERTQISPQEGKATSPPPQLRDVDFSGGHGPSPLRRQASISERREYEPAIDPLTHAPIPHSAIEPHQHPSPSGRESLEHTEGRRASNPHVGQLISERRASNQSPLGHRAVNNERRGSGMSSGSGRTGLSGAPLLPSLRLGGLPRIEVDPGSPAVGSAKAQTAPAELSSETVGGNRRVELE